MAWQSNTFRMEEKLSYLMTSKEMCDVTLVVGPEKISYPTHKFLLSIFSEVFHCMLYGSMALQTEEISLPKDNVDAVNVFLSFIYTNTVKIKSLDAAISSLYFADKYMVTYMKMKCLAFLDSNISDDSVLKIYETASAHKQMELKSKCWKYIIDYASEIINQDSIKYVRFETMSRLTAENLLQLESEIDMYNAVVKWGRYNFPVHTPENLRITLKPLLNEVRFTTMTPFEFIGSPCEDGILSENEQLDILKKLVTQRMQKLEQKQIQSKYSHRSSKRNPNEVD